MTFFTFELQFKDIKIQIEKVNRPLPRYKIIK